MLTHHRFSAALVISVSLAVLGLAVRNGGLALLSIPLLFYCVTLLISAGLLATPRITAVRRVGRSRLPEDETIDVSVAMASEGKPQPMVFVNDVLPAGTTLISGDVTYQGPLALGFAQEQISYVLGGVRGVYQFTAIHALICSRFGLAMQETLLEAPVELRFLPTQEKLGPIQIRPHRTRAFAGPIRSNLPGEGIDFYGCRAFSEGDDIRRINWRAYARTSELIINDYEQERITDVSLILDARIRAHAFVGTEHTFEFAAQATASLATSFCDQGHNVGLLVYGDVLNWVLPGVGRSQMDRIQDALSQAKLANKLAFEDLRQIPARLFPPYSQLVLISCNLNESDIDTLALLKSKGYAILFVSINTLPLEESVLPQSAETKLASRIAYLRRNLYLGSLARYGIQVVDWDPSHSLSEALERSRRIYRGRMT